MTVALALLAASIAAHAVGIAWRSLGWALLGFALYGAGTLLLFGGRP